MREKEKKKKAFASVSSSIVQLIAKKYITIIIIKEVELFSHEI
jgi:hypothetical protein